MLKPNLPVARAATLGLATLSLLAQMGIRTPAEAGGFLNLHLPLKGITASLNPQPLPPGGTVSLNPQPLPPRLFSPGSLVSLNPQPLPPGDYVSLNPQPLPPRILTPGDAVSLNPQPLPPRYLAPGDEVSLNPQPLPPKLTLVQVAVQPAPLPGGTIQPPVLLTPDLRIEQFDVQEQEGGGFSLHAVLRNGEAGLLMSDAYPGGGFLIIQHTSGTAESTDSGSADAEAAAEEDLRVPIPPLQPGEALDLTAAAPGRAIFSAFTAGVLDRDMSNNRWEVDTLISRTIPVDMETLRALLGETLDDDQIESRAEAMLASPEFRQALLDQLSDQLHEPTAGGQIIGISFDDSIQPVIYAELPQ